MSTSEIEEGTTASSTSEEERDNGSTSSSHASTSESPMYEEAETEEEEEFESEEENQLKILEIPEILHSIFLYSSLREISILLQVSTTCYRVGKSNLLWKEIEKRRKEYFGKQIVYDVRFTDFFFNESSSITYARKRKKKKQKKKRVNKEKNRNKEEERIIYDHFLSKIKIAEEKYESRMRTQEIRNREIRRKKRILKKAVRNIFLFQILSICCPQLSMILMIVDVVPVVSTFEVSGEELWVEFVGFFGSILDPLFGMACSGFCVQILFAFLTYFCFISTCCFCFGACCIPAMIISLYSICFGNYLSCCIISPSCSSVFSVCWYGRILHIDYFGDYGDDKLSDLVKCSPCSILLGVFYGIVMLPILGE